MAEPTLDALLQEDRTFPPPPAFAANALISDRTLPLEAEADWTAFWARQARDLIAWERPFTKVLEWDLPFAKWFEDGQLNVTACHVVLDQAPQQNFKRFERGWKTELQIQVSVVGAFDADRKRKAVFLSS